MSQQFFADNQAYTNHVSNLFITDEDFADLTDNLDKKTNEKLVDQAIKGVAKNIH